MTVTIDNTQDIIDSRDVIQRIAELEADEGTLDEFEEAELAKLQALAKEGEDYAEWEYGAAFIRHSYFTKYAEELATDICAITHGVSWPLSHIDWEAAAEELKADYTEIDFNGVPYFTRT